MTDILAAIAAEQGLTLNERGFVCPNGVEYLARTDLPEFELADPSCFEQMREFIFSPLIAAESDRS